MYVLTIHYNHFILITVKKREFLRRRGESIGPTIRVDLTREDWLPEPKVWKERNQGNTPSTTHSPVCTMLEIGRKPVSPRVQTMSRPRKHHPTNSDNLEERVGRTSIGRKALTKLSCRKCPRYMRRPGLRKCSREHWEQGGT